MAETLTDEQLRRDLKSSFPSVFATLVHLLSADWIWLQRWNGTSPPSWPDAEAIKTVADLRARCRDVEQGQQRFLAGMDDRALGVKLAYRSMKGDPFEEPIGLTMQHVVNHGAYHRGQVATMLRQLGVKPPNIDFISYVRANP